jgi:hypothetical protein
VPAEVVHVEAKIVGYKCRPGTEFNPNYPKWLKQRAVVMAEDKCSWDEGRPIVRIVGSWDITIECVHEQTNFGGFYDLKGVAKATFQCLN